MMNDILMEAYDSLSAIENVDYNEYLEIGNLFFESKGDRISRKLIKTVEKIKNEKPSEYTGPIDLKKYVDKNYNSLVKTASLLEKDIKNLRKSEVRDLIIGLGILISGYVIAIGGPILNPLGIISYTATGAATMFIGAAYLIVTIIISYIRTNKDWELLKDLNKIKTSLQRHVNNKKINDSTRKKISGIIEKIDDAQEEANQKVITTKESMNELDLIKLNIYESYDNGEITYGEKAYLLEQVDYMYDRFINESTNESTFDTLLESINDLY